MIKKAGNVEAKINLQPPFYIKEINSKYPKNHCPSAKKDKKNKYWEICNKVSKNKNKTKFYNSSSANQSQIQTPKKNKYYQGDYLVTGVNTTKIAKKNKNKTKDLSYIKCYTYKQKGHYANKCPKKA